MIEKIDWSTDFSVGIQKIDQQHKLIIEYINKLITQSTISVRSEQFHSILSDLIDYSNQHLKYEEKLLQIYDYPDFEEHKKVHDIYIETVSNFTLETMNKDNALVEKTLFFLKNWWTDHILKDDMEYKDFMNNKGVN